MIPNPSLVSAGAGSQILGWSNHKDLSVYQSIQLAQIHVRNSLPLFQGTQGKRAVI